MTMQYIKHALAHFPSTILNLKLLTFTTVYIKNVIEYKIDNTNILLIFRKIIFLFIRDQFKFENESILSLLILKNAWNKKITNGTGHRFFKTILHEQ